MHTKINLTLILFIIIIFSFKNLKAQSGNCLVFDGIDDYISTEYTPEDGSFSISAWVYIDSQTGSDVIAGTCTSEWDGYWLQIYNGKLSFRHGATDIQSTTTIGVHSWTHVAISYDGSSVKGYINGNLAFNQTITVTNTGGELYVGAIGSLLYGSTFFDGELDNVTFWSDFRSQGAIQSEIANGLVGNEMSLEAYFPFNQGAPNQDNTNLFPQAVDRAKCNHGVLHNFSMNAANSNWMYTSIAKEPVISTIDYLQQLNTVTATANIFMTGSSNPYTRGFQVSEYICFDGFGVLTEQENGNFYAGEFTMEIDNLDPETTYYLRSFATNSEGTSYGETIQFTTRQEAPGNALNFDGTTDIVYTDVPPVFQDMANNSITLEAIIKPSDIAFSRVLAAQYNSNNKAALSVGENKIFVNFTVSGTEYAVRSETTFNPEIYNHIAVSYNSNTHEILIYLNGELLSTIAGTDAGTNSSGYFIVGSNASVYQFTGNIDEVRVWNYERDICDIQANMNTELFGSEEGLEIYYNFNHGVAGGNNTGITTVTDYSGNSRHGILESFTLSGSSSNWIASEAELSGVNVFQDISNPVPDVENLPELTGDCEVTLVAPTATDPCQGEITGTTTTVSPVAETTTVTWTYDDGYGNIITQEQLVTIADEENPTISCPNSLIVDLEEGVSSYIVTDGSLDPVSVNDNCSVFETINDYNNTTTLNNEEFTADQYTITWTTTDNAGNTESCTYLMTVRNFVDVSELLDTDISVYPNPGNGLISVENADDCMYQVSDISGKILIEGKIKYQNENLDLTNFEKGIYFIKFTNNKIVKTRKVILE